jgi:hypothetical protein
MIVLHRMWRPPLRQSVKLNEPPLMQHRRLSKRFSDANRITSLETFIAKEIVAVEMWRRDLRTNFQCRHRAMPKIMAASGLSSWPLKVSFGVTHRRLHYESASNVRSSALRRLQTFKSAARRRWLTTLIVTLSPAIAQNASPFDGRWNTTVICKSSKDPAGVKFVTEVRTASWAARPAPKARRVFFASMVRSPAGVGHVYAKGRSVTGDSVSGRELLPGTEYTYYILAKFEGKGGSGNRVEGRACEIKFEKR